MRHQEVFNKIGSIITELNEQYEYLKPLPVPVDDLELELLNANANFLCDHLEILRKLNTALNKGNQAMKSVPDTESMDAVNDEINPDHFAGLTKRDNVYEDNETGQPDTADEDNPGFEFDLTTAESLTSAEQNDMAGNDIAYFEDELQEQGTTLSETPAEGAHTPHVDIKPDTGQENFSFIRSTEPDVIRHELELSEADTFGEDEDEPHEETVAEALAQVDTTKETIAEPAIKPDEKPLTLNERIAAQSSNIQQVKPVQPIADLKSAINLNDKMLFVRDLFNGYSLAYSEAIEILNRFTKLEDAERFLSVNYETKNNWAGKPATREKFYDLLKLRFA